VKGRYDVASWRAALWCVGALRDVRRGLAAGRVTDVHAKTPPKLPARALSGVEGVLHRRPNTCLMRALVLQAWYRGQGEERDIVIGVTAPSSGFRAHAWIEGEPPCHDEHFSELTRWSGTAPGGS
jgi:hypothetical protein